MAFMEPSAIKPAYGPMAIGPLAVAWDGDIVTTFAGVRV